MDKLKDQYFQPLMLKKLAKEIDSVEPGFSAKAFIEAVHAKPWEALELMDRMRKITDCLRDALPRDYVQALAILRSVAAGVSGFDSLLFPDFVQRFGVAFPDESIPALEYFTELCSSEMGVRPFIERYPDRMFRQLKQWAKSKNTDHRRLASEGCRPRLPWASALNELKKDPAPILPILELLKDDPELYVRRSVANNLNDISKDHPDIVVEIMKRWQGSTKETDWIIKHACRTMLKQGRPDVLSLFGFASPTFIRGSELRFEKKRVRIGGETTFRASIHTSRAKLGKLRLEYVVHFIKSNGQPSPKVFQISEREQSSNSIEVKKRHSFRDLSTRKHFPGIHRVELRVNGVCKGEGSIDVFV